MAREAELPVDERILPVLEHLGIQQAHFAASNPLDWQGLVTTHPEVISSLTLVSPRAIDPGVLGTLASRLLNQSQGGNYILQRWQRRGSFHHQCVGSGL